MFGYNLNFGAAALTAFGGVTRVQYFANPNDATPYLTYNIQYDLFGNVARIELPAGGAYEFDYDYSTEGHMDGAYRTPSFLKEKRVYTSASADRTTGWVQRMTFSGYTGYGTSSTPPTVVQYYVPASPVNGIGVLAGKENHYFFHESDNLNLSASNVMSAWDDNREYKTEVYDSDGATLLKTITNAWDQRSCDGATDRVGCAWLTSTYGWNLEGSAGSGPTHAPAHDPRMTSETVTYGSEVSQTLYGYDSYNNQTSEAEYAFGPSVPGALVRTTTTTHSTDTSFPNGSSYISANVVSLPWVKTLKDGANTQIAQTTYTYDVGTPTSESGIIQYQAPASSARGNLTSMMQWLHDPLGQPDRTLTWQFQYDVAGNVTETLDPRGVCKTWGYAGSGNTFALPTSATLYPGLNCTGAGQTTSAVYDYNIAKLTSATDANSKTTSYDYTDALDRLKTITRPTGGGNTAFSYNDTIGSLAVTTAVAQSSGNPITTTVNYDGLGRTTRAVRAAACASGAAKVDTSYDGRGRVYQVSTPYCPTDSPGYTTTAYDGLHRPRNVTTPGGAITTISYTTSSLGQVATVSVPAMVAGAQGAITHQNTTDSQGRLIQVIENPGGSSAPTTTYSYDVLDSLTGVNQSGLSRSFFYDSLKRLRQANNPESGQTTYSYDDSGNLYTKLDARSITTTSSYDGLNRIQSKSYSNSPTGVSYAYDNIQSGCNGIGRLSSVTYGSNLNNYSCYDTMGHVTTSSQTIAGTVYPAFQYEWDLSGALHSETYPSGRTLTNSYDTAGQVNEVQGSMNGNATTYASNVFYAAQGAIQSLALGNGLAETWTYGTPEQQPTQLLVARAGTPMLTLGWGYGAEAYNNGNVQTQTITAGAASWPQTYTYDALNRLLSVQESGTTPWSQNYQYDGFGNIWVASQTVGVLGWIAGGTPQGSNWYAANNNRASDPANPWIYDGSGNLQHIPASTQNGVATLLQDYTCDVENRQLTATINNVQTTYAYDGEGRRVSKTSGSQTTTYVYDAFGNLAAEYGAGGGSLCGTPTCYETQDTLGNLRLLTDSNNPVQNWRRYDYFPYGEELLVGINGRTQVQGYVLVGDGSEPKFGGQYRDYESGLDWFKNRYYAGVQGRFASPDRQYFQKEMLSDPQRFNLYAYARNNPLAFVDPTGEAIELSLYKDERDKQIAALCGAASLSDAQCKNYIYVDKTTKKGHYYVGIMNGGQSGKDPQFASLNQVAGFINDAVVAPNVATLHAVDERESFDNGTGSITSLGFHSAAGATVTNVNDSQRGQTDVYVMIPGKSGYPALDADRSSDGQPIYRSYETILMHELGHFLYRIENPRDDLNSPAEQDAAVALENKVRQLKDPSGPIRKKH